MQAKCRACCTCAMYESIVKDRLIPLSESIRRDRTSLNSTLSAYENAVLKWNDRLKKAVPEDITISMTATPLDAAATDLPEGVAVTGKMNRCGCTVVVRNDSFVSVRVIIENIDANGEIFQATAGCIRDGNPVIVPVKNGTELLLQSGKSATVSYFVRLGSFVRTDDQTGFRSKATIAVYDGERLVTRKTKSVAI